MKFLLCVMMVSLTVSDAGRIPRSFDAPGIANFPNLQTVHHGHGATSYQNFQIENHGEISIPTKVHSTSHHYVYPERHAHDNTELNDYEVSSVTATAPYLIQGDTEDQYYVSKYIEPYTSNDIGHVEINNIAEQSAYYDEHIYDQGYDYGYH